eukprot:COSAG06_NODE_3049_length_5919_cov_3.625773_4_plen_97_part_00
MLAPKRLVLSTGKILKEISLSACSQDAAKGFAPDTRVVFKINVTSGRDINAYSFFPQEGEILLSPSHRFTVSSEPREEGGYTYIDLVQVAGNTFVS